MNSIIWLGTLGVLYLFFISTTPVKAPAPKKVEVEVVATEAPAAEAKPEAIPAEVVVEAHPVDMEKGKAIYLSTCIKCHNKDPNVKGPIGPELVDAPLELMQHKVVTGRYPEVLPEGFVPKRKTKQMTKFPQLEKDVPSIHAYVQSLKKK
jgi:mono/diheme cytochrome c family protein